MKDNFFVIKLSDTKFHRRDIRNRQLVFTLIDFIGKFLIVENMMTLIKINRNVGHVSLKTIMIQSFTFMNNQTGKYDKLSFYELSFFSLKLV
jgi:hypothetical protein